MLSAECCAVLCCAVLCCAPPRIVGVLIAIVMVSVSKVGSRESNVQAEQVSDSAFRQGKKLGPFPLPAGKPCAKQVGARVVFTSLKVKSTLR